MNEKKNKQTKKTKQNKTKTTAAKATTVNETKIEVHPPGAPDSRGGGWGVRIPVEPPTNSNKGLIKRLTVGTPPLQGWRAAGSTPPLTQKLVPMWGSCFDLFPNW